MANLGNTPISATQIGSYFVQQYYQVFRQQRDFVHHFYTDESSMIRVEGENSHCVSDMMQIHHLIMSLDFTGIEIKRINSLESWNGGILVVVTGSVKSRDAIGWKKFSQTFFLAPQEKGYFVLNDMFHFDEEEVVNQPAAPALHEDHVDYQSPITTHLPEPPVSDYSLEGMTREYVDQLHNEEDEPIQEYSYQESEFYHQKPHLESEIDNDTLEEEISMGEAGAMHHNIATSLPDHLPVEAEPFEEPEKLTYASILRAKGKSSTVSYPPSSTQSTIVPAPAPAPAPLSHTSDWNLIPQPLPQHSVPIVQSSGMEFMEGALSLEEGESKSVYVRNLPSTVSTLDILQAFKSFGKIVTDGVFLKNRKDTGVCYAFVEFEDLPSVQNAIKASPILLAGRQVYIEERRPNNGASRGGTGRGHGRGRGGLDVRTFGRGSDQNGTDSSRVRTNGFRGS